MPEVPYQPYPDVQPPERILRPGGVPPVPEAFGVGVANAVRTFGGDVEKAGSEVFDRALALRRLQIEGKLRDMTTDYYNEIAPIQSDFLKLRGENATQDAMNAHLAQINQVRQKYAALAGQYGPYGANTFGADSAALTRSFTNEATRHSAQQFENAQIASSKARIEQIKSQPVDVFDEKGLNGKIQDIKNQYLEQQPIQGWSDVTRDELAAKDISDQYYIHSREVAKRAPWQALNFIAQHRGDFRDKDYQLAQDFALDQTHTVGARQISNVVNQGGESVAGVPGAFVEQIKTMEGFVPKAKWDVKQWSVGYGTRARYPGEVVTKTEAEQRFNDGLTNASRVVDSVNPNLTEGTRAALISLTYNTGDGWVKAGLGKAIAAGDEDAAKLRFGEYVNVAGQRNEVIAARRNQELSWWGKTELSEAPLERRVQQGLALAHELSPNDPIMEHYVEQYVRQGYTARKQAEFDDNFNARQSVYSALITGDATGKLPSSVEDLKADPQTAEAWAHMRPDQRANVLRYLASPNRDKVAMTDDRLRTYRTLLNESDEDPVKFLQEDLLAADLPLSTKKELIQRQASVHVRAEQDPRLGHAMEILSAKMPNSIPNKSQDPDGWAEFRGGVYAALEQAQSQLQRPLKDEEITELGKMLIQTVPGTGFWHTKAGTYPVFNPPEQLLGPMREQYPGETDDQLRGRLVQEYTRTRFNELYGASGGATR
jgi:GH24 family phage-related lysozyme (muramidase)